MVWRRRKRSRSEGPGAWALSGGDMRYRRPRAHRRLAVERFLNPSFFCTMTLACSLYLPQAHRYSVCGYDIGQVLARHQRLTSDSRTASTGQNGLGMPPFLNPVMYDSQLTVRPCTLRHGPRSSCSHWLSIMFQIHLRRSGERKAVQLTPTPGLCDSRVIVLRFCEQGATHDSFHAHAQRS